MEQKAAKSAKADEATRLAHFRPFFLATFATFCFAASYSEATRNYMLRDRGKADLRERLAILGSLQKARAGAE